LLLFCDVTERKNAEKNIYQAQEKYKTLFQLCRDAAFIFSADSGIILDANKKACELTKRSLQELTNMHQSQLFSPVENNYYQQMLDKYLNDESEVPIEVEIITKDYLIVPVEITASKIDINGENIIYCLYRDIREKRRFEEQIRHTENLASIGQLTGGIAHDFNNQLMVIQGYTGELEHELGLNKNAQDAIDQINEAVKNSAGIIRQLLYFSGKKKGVMKQIKIRSILNSVVNLFERTVDKRIIMKKNYKIDDDFIYGDKEALYNAFLNLALNARDAMPEGGTLEFSIDDCIIDTVACMETYGNQLEHGDYVNVIISDTGIGIEKDILPRIFDPYFSTKGHGNGLGLAGVYGTITRSHQGWIEVESTITGDTKGSRFSILLPKYKNAVIEEQKTKKLKKGAGTILVVDDEIQIANILVRSAKRIGFESYAAYNGKEGLDFLNKYQIDLVIVDQNMPGMTGNETAKHIRALQPEIKIILSTGYESESQFEKGKKEQLYDGYLQKPFDVETFSEKIHEILNED